MKARLAPTGLGAAVLASVSTLVVSPLLSGGSDTPNKTPGDELPAGHASHHQD